MSSSKPSFIVYSFQGIQDPLFRGLILQYLKKINTPEVRYHFHVITYEQEQYMTSPAERTAFRNACAPYGIYWYPVRYHTAKRFTLFYRLWDFVQSIRQAVRIKARYPVKAILGYLVIAGAFSFIISRLLGLRLAIYCFEPHSEYMVDFGDWTRKALSYRLLNGFERLEATYAEYLAVPTSHTLKLVQSWKPRAREIFQVPISVDTDKFRFSEQHRQLIRQQFGMEERPVVLYLGKFGGLYYAADAVAQFSYQLYQHDPTLFFFTITPDDTDRIASAYRQAGLPESAFLVHDKVPYDEVERYISVADIGLVAIPPLPSQKYRTPVKVGNYLSCGLPYIITKGIADDDVLATQEQVGAVFDSLSPRDFGTGWPQVKSLLAEDKTSLRNRCRRIGIRERGLQRTEAVLRQILKRMS